MTDELEVVVVTRRDYPDAPEPGDTTGFVITTANGVHVTHPYRSRETAERIIAEYGGYYDDGGHIVEVALAEEVTKRDGSEYSDRDLLYQIDAEIETALELGATSSTLLRTLVEGLHRKITEHIEGGT